MLIEVSDREHATVLAALRLWQRQGVDGDNEFERGIATNAGQHEPLSVDEIDKLCTRINPPGGL